MGRVRDDGISIHWVTLATVEATPIGISTSDQQVFHKRTPSICAVRERIPHLNGAVFASISSLLSRLKSRRHDANSSVAGEVSRTAYLPVRGTYAYEVLQHRFKEFDNLDEGFINEGDLRIALKKLNLPASEEEIQSFVAELEKTYGTAKISFGKFLEYSVQRENQLVDTFKELDRQKMGYLTIDQLKAAFERYKFRVADKDIEKLVGRLHMRGTAFGSCNVGLDFSEYRACLMSLTIQDLKDTFGLWQRAMIDLGNMNFSFAFSSVLKRHDTNAVQTWNLSNSSKPRGRCDKSWLLGQYRAKSEHFMHLLVSTISGAISKTAVAPLERCKLLSILNMGMVRSGLLSCFSQIWRKEGVCGLFKGNLLDVISIAPTKVVEYTVYDKLKELLFDRTEHDNINTFEHVVCSSLSSIAGALISHPIHTVRVAIISRVDGYKYGAMECANMILSVNGYHGFYRGIVPKLIQVASYVAINFSLYDQLKWWYRRKIEPGGEVDILANLCCGILAGAISQAALYPLETIQYRLQAHAIQHLPMIHKSMIDALWGTLQQEGVQALYAGMLPSYLKMIPAAIISLVVYRPVRESLDHLISLS